MTLANGRDVGFGFRDSESQWIVQEMDHLDTDSKLRRQHRRIGLQFPCIGDS